MAIRNQHKTTLRLEDIPYTTFLSKWLLPRSKVLGIQLKIKATTNFLSVHLNYSVKKAGMMSSGAHSFFR